MLTNWEWCRQVGQESKKIILWYFLHLEWFFFRKYGARRRERNKEKWERQGVGEMKKKRKIRVVSSYFVYSHSINVKIS